MSVASSSVARLTTDLLDLDAAGLLAAASEAEQPAASGERKYTLARGDNLWDIAEQFYGDGAAWKKTSEANPGLRPRALPVGREITIPAN